MAGRIDASGDKLSRTANLPALNNFTIAGWGYRHSAHRTFVVGAESRTYTVTGE